MIFEDGKTPLNAVNLNKISGETLEKVNSALAGVSSLHFYRGVFSDEQDNRIKCSEIMPTEHLAEGKLIIDEQGKVGRIKQSIAAWNEPIPLFSTEGAGSEGELINCYGNLAPNVANDNSQVIFGLLLNAFYIPEGGWTPEPDAVVPGTLIIGEDGYLGKIVAIHPSRQDPHGEFEIVLLGMRVDEVAVFDWGERETVVNNEGIEGFLLPGIPDLLIKNSQGVFAYKAGSWSLYHEEELLITTQNMPSLSSQLRGAFGLQVIDGNLVITYSDKNAPNLSIVDGELIYNY